MLLSILFVLRPTVGLQITHLTSHVSDFHCRSLSTGLWPVTKKEIYGNERHYVTP